MVAALVRCEGEERKGMAHKLKGSALALGLDDFAAQCAALEAGDADPAGLAGEFDAAVAMYRRFGFVECGPFADYREDPFSRFMTRRSQ